MVCGRRKGVADVFERCDMLRSALTFPAERVWAPTSLPCLAGYHALLSKVYLA